MQRPSPSEAVRTRFALASVAPISPRAWRHGATVARGTQDLRSAHLLSPAAAWRLQAALRAVRGAHSAMVNTWAVLLRLPGERLVGATAERPSLPHPLARLFCALRRCHHGCGSRRCCPPSWPPGNTASDFCAAPPGGHLGCIGGIHGSSTARAKPRSIGQAWALTMPDYSPDGLDGRRVAIQSAATEASRRLDSL